VSDASLLVECCTHGPAFATFVCRHVVFGTGQGFVASGEDPDDPCPDAWCDKCNRRQLASGGAWTDETEAFAEITLLCNGCYEVARARNQRAH